MVVYGEDEDSSAAILVVANRSSNLSVLISAAGNASVLLIWNDHGL